MLRRGARRRDLVTTTTSGAGSEAIVKAAGIQAAALRDRGAEIERARRLPEPFVRAFEEAGLFRLCLPRSFGGSELPLADLVRVLETLATGDAAAGWCAMIASTTSALAAWIEPRAAREIFSSPGAVTGGVFAPTGRATRTAGGFTVSGRWSFGSGCQHCTSLLGGAIVVNGAGPELSPQGRPDIRLCFFPAEEVEILDTWHVSGLSGTGSHDLAVRDRFVADAHAVSLLSDAPREAGTLYRFPVFGLLAVGVASIALGIARRAIDELVALAAKKTPALAQKRLADRGTAQVAVAQAEGALGGARSFLLATIDDVWRRVEAGGTLTLVDRARVRIAAAHAVRDATRAVDLVYELGGGSSIYQTSPLQRCFRDVHVVTQHASVASGSLELAGRALLGVDADYSIL
jgi:alkylation response protein AidB-like acyl-CoA dehydrogenase